jgi:cell division GTPase FtsZ
VLSRLQALDDGDIDALFVCAGLGGSVAGNAPELVSYLKKSMVEPVFGLCTLPCRQEGDARSSLAADQLDELLNLLDGIVLFDNESWKDRVPSLSEDEGYGRSGDLKSLIGRKSTPQQPVSGRERFYSDMNNLISSRFTLLLRAGEFSDRETGELPQVVLDAGEILNTIQGMGFVTVGYARDQVAGERPLDLLSRIRPGAPGVQDGHLKASRVVELTKKAIFDEISTPTELEKAKKALILIAGPSHDMSMKGFMTVRRWIDRTIGGLELRSGDYPVSGTSFLGIFIMLAGMDTLPRVEEIRKIRDSARGTDSFGPPA